MATKLQELESSVLAKTELEKRLEVAQASERRLTSELERRGHDLSANAKAVDGKLREVERSRIELDVELRAANARLADLQTQLASANAEACILSHAIRSFVLACVYCFYCIVQYKHCLQCTTNVHPLLVQIYNLCMYCNYRQDLQQPNLHTMLFITFFSRCR